MVCPKWHLLNESSISHQDPEFYDGHPALRPSGQPAAVKLAPANLLGQAGKVDWMIARRRQLTHIPVFRCIETPVCHIAVAMVQGRSAKLRSQIVPKTGDDCRDAGGRATHATHRAAQLPPAIAAFVHPCMADVGS